MTAHIWHQHSFAATDNDLSEELLHCCHSAHLSQSRPGAFWIAKQLVTRHNGHKILSLMTTPRRQGRAQGCNTVALLSHQVSHYASAPEFYNWLSHTRRCSPFFAFERRCVISLTVEKWSGLLCKSTEKHAVVWYQGRTGCLRAPVFTLYLPGCRAPLVGVRLEHIVFLIVHTGGHCKTSDLESDMANREWAHLWATPQTKGILSNKPWINLRQIWRDDLRRIHYLLLFFSSEALIIIIDNLSGLYGASSDQWNHGGRGNETTALLSLEVKSSAFI